jgi:hypothetical protein
MMIVSCDPSVGGCVVADSSVGWGGVGVDSVLYFSGDTRKLLIHDDLAGLSTGRSFTDSFAVNSAIPLRVCLVWSDTAGAVGANPTLVNDLDLELTAPSGTYYRGNIYSGGQSVPDPSTWDAINVEECCRINSPELGKWYITIYGQSVPYDPQQFAYAITGDIQELIIGAEEGYTVAPQIENVSLNTISTGKISLKIQLSKAGVVQARIFDLAGRLVETVVDGKLPAGQNVVEHTTELSNGVYFVQVTAGSTKEIRKVLIIR